jgi:hypothetical protein
MVTLPRLRAIAAAAGATVAMLAAAPASAGVYAASHLEISGLSLVVSSTSATVINSFTFDLANTASMNGPAVASSASCNSNGLPACGFAPVLDAAAVNAPGSSPLRPAVGGEGTFLGHLATSYSGSDSIIKAAELVTGTPTATEQIAESLLNTNGFARSNSEIESNTTLTWTTSIGSGGVLDLSFLADPDQRAEILGAAGVYSAQSNLTTSFTLTSNADGSSVSWSPQGTVANNCDVNDNGAFGAVTCVETADSQDLNRNVATGTNPSTVNNSYDIASILTAFGIHVQGLSAGTYSIALNAVTSTSITRAVPEPGTTGLIGAALAGLALTSLRRRQK